MRQRCIIVASDNGELIKEYKNPEVSSFLIRTYPDGENDPTEIREAVYFNKKHQVNLIIAMYDLKIGKILDGKIVIRDQLKPFYLGNPSMHYKYNTHYPSTISKQNGQIIYRDFIFDWGKGYEDIILKEDV